MKNIQHTYNSMLYIHTITIAINKILSNTNVPYRKYKLIKCFNQNGISALVRLKNVRLLIIRGKACSNKTHNYSHPGANCTCGWSLYSPRIKGYAALTLARSRVASVELPTRRFASGDMKKEVRKKRGKNDNEYFNKPRPIYFERDYARRCLRFLVNSLLRAIVF